MASGAADTKPGLGMFAGVFTPSILTILGIILFLRLGFVVGNAGLGGALVIIAIATAVSLLTSVSLAAISSNMQVKGGGDYYLISRTLGAGFGGAIGIVLFVAQSVSIAFYAIGFAEAVVSVVGVDNPWATQGIALGAVAVLFALAWAGADVATRFQFFIMAILALALGSFYVGAVPGFEAGMATDGFTAPDGSPGFWILFGIFFPAVTGFTQGVSMSGDLRNASASLARGTFLAVGVSTVVYVTVAILLAGTVEQADLVADGGEGMVAVSIFGPLVVAGVVAATLSSAMASFLGAPRILQSLASDRIFPLLNPFAHGVGPAANPRRAVLLSAAIAVGTIGLGSLNVIAPVVSMFFLISYGLLNYATYYEAAAKSPSFRPRFRFFNRWTSLAGTLVCVGAMLAINWVAGAAAGIVLFGLYRYASTRQGPDRWADATSAHHFQRAKESIAALSAQPDHARNWRPQILSFSADPERRARLLRFATWLEGDAGLAATFQIVVGEGALKRRELVEVEEALAEQIDDLGLPVYGRAILAKDALAAVPVIVQSFGVGKLEANTVLFGWPENDDPGHLDAYVRALRELARLGMHVVALSSDWYRWRALDRVDDRHRRIDVVWTDDDSGRLAVLAAYLCTRTEDWAGATVRVVGHADAEAIDEGRTTLEDLLHSARIPAEVSLVEGGDVGELIAACVDASMVMIPMRLRDGRILDPTGRPLAPIVAELPMVSAIMAGAPFPLVVQPDDGPAAEISRADEAVDQAERRLAVLEKQVAEAGASGSGEEADERLSDLERRTLKARARVDRARADLEQVLDGQR
jgi:amino acid transporter